jgi:hypothetical protein
MGQQPQQNGVSQRDKWAAQIGIVLGVVFIIMGIASGSTAIWIIGLIVLAIGALSRIRIRKEA